MERNPVVVQEVVGSWPGVAAGSDRSIPDRHSVLAQEGE